MALVGSAIRVTVDNAYSIHFRGLQIARRKSSWQNHDDCCFDHRRARSHLLSSSLPQHAACPNCILCLTCFLGGHLTAWMSQILCLLPVDLPILPAYRNHHPSHRSTVSTYLMVREPSFEALDWGHVKARRHLPSSLSSTADDAATPWAEEARIFSCLGEGGDSN